jgi:hypothetical protein
VNPTWRSPPLLTAVEAVICFGPASVGVGFLCLEVPIAGMSGQLRGNESILMLLEAAGGIAGVVGVIKLTMAAITSPTVVRNPVLTLALLCVGAFTAAAVAIHWQLSPALVFACVVAPLFAIGHFLYLTNAKWYSAAPPSRFSRFQLELRAALILICAIAGAFIGSARFGLQADYYVVNDVSQTAIEARYGKLLDEIDAIAGLAEPEKQNVAPLHSALERDPTVLRVELRRIRTGADSEILFEHLARGHFYVECIRRPGSSTSPFVTRCHAPGINYAQQDNHGIDDVLRYERHGWEDPSGKLYLVIDFDYPMLRKQLR